MAKYFYSKYNVTTSTVWTEGAFSSGSSTTISFGYLYKSYSFDQTNNTFNVAGGKWYSTSPIPGGSVGYRTIDNGIARYTLYYEVLNSNEDAEFSLSYKYASTSTSTIIYAKGALVQSNIIAENGTYPTNGESGGYWYVRGSIATYTVTFKDWNGTVLKTQTVNYGENATPPSQPTRTGYTFNSWSGSYTNVISDRVITATYDVYIPPNPPSAPSSISVPATIKGGEGIAISWGSGSGASRYYLYRSFNGGGYTQIYSGTSRSYSETTSKDWLTIQYRVRAYNSDGYSGYRTSNIVNVIKFPEIYENVNGTQVVYEAGWENVNGTWVEIDSVWENVNGVWVEL